MTLYERCFKRFSGLILHFFDKVLDNYAENYLDYYDNVEYEDNFTIGEKDGKDAEMLQGPIKDFFLKWLKKLAPSLYNKYFGNGDYVAPTPYPKHSDVFIYEKEAIGELSEKYDCYNNYCRLLMDRLGFIPYLKTQLSARFGGYKALEEYRK